MVLQIAFHCAAHMKAYEEAKLRYTKTMQAENAVIDARPVGARQLLLSRPPRRCRPELLKI